MLTDNIIRGLKSSHLNSFPINFPTFNNLKNVNQCSWRVTQEHWSHLFLTQKHFTCSLLLNRKSSPWYSSHLQHQLNHSGLFYSQTHCSQRIWETSLCCSSWSTEIPLPLKIYFLYETFTWYSPRLPPLILLINNFLHLILIVLIYMSFTTFTFI